MATGPELPRRSLSGSAPTDSITQKLFALIARCHQMLGDLPGTLAVCSEGLTFTPMMRSCSSARLWCTAWRVSRPRRRRPGGALFTLKRPEQFCSVDQGIYGHLTLRNLAALAAERGDHPEAQRIWKSILEECTGDAEATARLAG